VSVRDLSPEAVERYLARLVDDDANLSARTINAPLVAVKAMLNWAVSTRRIPFNPLSCIKAVTGEKRKVRRALTEDEISRLLKAAQEGPLRRGMRSRQNRPKKDGSYKAAPLSLQQQAEYARSGRNSVMLYRLMIEAGLRLNEARSLRWADVDLPAATLNLRAETTKNGKASSLPLSPGLQTALQAWKDETQDESPVCVVRVTSRALRCFDDDLMAARIEKRDAAGRTLDLHALRHTCGTRLVASGADIKTVQSNMRHSTAALTLGVYVHKDKGRMAAAVAGLPELQPAQRENAAAKLSQTGTDACDKESQAFTLMPQPPSIRQGTASNIFKAMKENTLQDSGAMAVNHRVPGSNPGQGAI
jgi:integrase